MPVRHVHLLATGSRGDAEPVLALGVELARRGHAVTLVGSSDHVRMAEDVGVHYVDLGYSVRELLCSGTGEAMVAARSASGSRTALVAAAVRLIGAVGPRLLAACRDADVLLVNETVFLLGASLAEASRELRLIAMAFVPYGRTAHERSFYADDLSAELPALATHDAVQRRHAAQLLPAINALRASELGLDPLDVDDAVGLRERCPALHAYSARTCPPPADWPSHRAVTGYWRREVADASLPEPLRDFLAAGRPPIYVGFGSMAYDPSVVVRAVCALAVRRGWRFVLCRGWLGDAAIPQASLVDGVLAIGDVPHAQLFPHLAAAVHHGGAGTTAASLTAGIPTLIAWLIVDQPMWAARVEALGVGHDLGALRELSEARLERGLDRVLDDPEMLGRAAALGHELRSESGCRVAAERLTRGDW